MDQSMITPVVPEPQKSSFPKWPLIALFSFFLGIASVLLYQRFLPTRTVLVAPSLSVDQTAGWRIYTNTSAGYLIKYPQDWKTGNIAAGAGSGEAVPNARYLQIFPPQISLGSLGIEELQMIPPSEEASLTVEKTVNGIVLKCNGSFTSDTKIWCWVKVPHQEKYLNIQVFKEQNESINQTFDLILTTFKFTGSGEAGGGKTCQYNGITYQDGEEIPDKCNFCSCESGQVACTLKACEE